VLLTGGALTIAITTATLLERSTETLTRAGLGALSVGGVYLLLFVLNPDGIGAGDVKLAAVTGLALGSNGWHTVIVGLLLPYLLCAPFAAAIVLRRHGHRAAHIPFGPFLIAGSITAVLLHSGD
jgi:leader peptidase (prepilin peptidase)/N-methyltransferase